MNNKDQLLNNMVTIILLNEISNLRFVKNVTVEISKVMGIS